MGSADDTLGAMIEGLRDSRRPEMDLVVDVLQEAFASQGILAKEVLDGTDGTWMWEDTSMMESIPRFYILSRSNAKGMEGYPLFTVRQAYSVKMDTWLVMSSIVPGPDRSGISRSLSLLIAQHAGAWAGVRFTVAASTLNGGHPHAGVIAARELMTMKPPVYENLDAKVQQALDDGYVVEAPVSSKKREMN